jgi:hypothetical protein
MKKNRIFSLGMLVMALAFALVFMGCNTDADDDATYTLSWVYGKFEALPTGIKKDAIATGVYLYKNGSIASEDWTLEFDVSTAHSSSSTKITEVTLGYFVDAGKDETATSLKINAKVGGKVVASHTFTVSD